MDIAEAGHIAQILSQVTKKVWRAGKLNREVSGLFVRNEIVLYVRKKADEQYVYAIEVPHINRETKNSDIMILAARLVKQMIPIPPIYLGG